MELFATLIEGNQAVRMWGYTVVGFKHMTNKFVVWI